MWAVRLKVQRGGCYGQRLNLHVQYVIVALTSSENTYDTKGICAPRGKQLQSLHVNELQRLQCRILSFYHKVITGIQFTKKVHWSIAECERERRTLVGEILQSYRVCYDFSAGLTFRWIVNCYRVSKLSTIAKTIIGKEPDASDSYIIIRFKYNTECAIIATSFIFSTHYKWIKEETVYWE